MTRFSWFILPKRTSEILVIQYLLLHSYLNYAGCKYSFQRVEACSWQGIPERVLRLTINVINQEKPFFIRLLNDITLNFKQALRSMSVRYFSVCHESLRVILRVAGLNTVS